MTEQEVADEPRHTTAFLVPVKVAAAILVAILAAFAVGGWRLSALQQDYTRKIAHSALHTSCETGNDFRSLDQARWHRIIGLFGNPSRAEARQFITALVEITAQADKQRDCSKF